MEAPLLLPVSTAAGASSISIIDDSTVEAVASSPPPHDDDDGGGGGDESSPSTRSIVFRVVAVLVVACASLFAQHEASKGFAIDVVHNGGAPRGSAAAGRRFHLLFVSNGRAERILHRASRRVERALFPDASFPRKRVTRVTLTMADHNLTAAANAVVDAAAGDRGEYVISLSPGLLMTDKADDAVAAAVRRAVARMWLWNGRGGAPARLTESMVEYLSTSGTGEMMTWQPEREEEQCMSARFLRHLEQRRSGFVARLNRAMRDRWSDAAVDAALGAPARPLCAAYLAAAATVQAATQLADSTSDGAARGSSVAM